MQEWLEHRFASEKVQAWTFERDQKRDETDISRSLKEMIRDSAAVIFLLSPNTIEAGAAQWMELAYADAFGIPTFILLHHLSYAEVVSVERGVPPLIRQSQCTPAAEWRELEPDLRRILAHPRHGGHAEMNTNPEGTSS